MRNITPPVKTVSFEDALRNLAAKLTGKPAASLPRSQEATVQFMAETLPNMDELAEAITKEVMARITAATPAGEPQESNTQKPQVTAGDDKSGSAEEPEDDDATGSNKAAKNRKSKPNTD